MYEGKTVENMVDWLYENCGQPAQSFELISPETLRTSTTSTEPSIQILGLTSGADCKENGPQLAHVPNLRVDGSLDSSY